VQANYAPTTKNPCANTAASNIGTTIGSPPTMLIAAPSSGSTATADRPGRSMIWPVTNPPIVPPSEYTDVVSAYVARP
jgi:hypothetical protein